ncbi:MAG: FAD-binding oxidoreductase [bacterium]
MESYLPKNPLLEKGVSPSRVYKPADARELQNIVYEANQNNEKLVPVSSAAPHQKGGTMCAEPHSIVDLSDWKQVLHVDRRNRVAMIEPGVTYPELVAALEPYKLTVSLPLTPRPGKSVLAAVLDREPSTWPNKQWDIADPLASMEVVFGDGSIFRTGAAGGPGSLTKQRESGGAQKSPMGPAQTDFHRVVGGSQGSFGIATWITMRCELMPSISEPRLIGSKTLPPPIEFLYAVQKAGLGEHCFILDRAALLMLLAGGIARPGELPEFVALLNVCGFERLSKERVEYQRKDLDDMAVRFHVSLSERISEATAHEVLARAMSASGESDWRRGRANNFLSLFFLSTLDRAPFFVDSFSAVAAAHDIRREDYCLYLQPVVQNHACHYEFIVPFDGSQTGEVQKMKELEKTAVRALTEAGAFWSRPYGAAADMEPGLDPAGYDLLQKVKKVFDPGRVLSPGRFGL